jgi:hypothetical protein
MDSTPRSKTGLPSRRRIRIELSEMALAHAVDDKTEAAYKRSDLVEKRRRLMAEWAQYCAKPSVKGNVLPLRGAR